MSGVEHQRPGRGSDPESDNEAAAAHDPTWTFARESDELTIVRQAASQGCALVVALNDSPKIYSFRDERSMVRFQADMETLLTHTGWSFVGFQPERRGRRDRRTMPRINERRRWWTDGWLFSGK